MVPKKSVIVKFALFLDFDFMKKCSVDGTVMDFSTVLSSDPNSQL